VPMNLAMWILAYSDIYLLRRLTGPQKALSEVGLYQYAHEICLLLVLPITSFNLAWPQFLFANYRRPEAKEIFSRAQLYFAFFLIEIAFLLSVFSDRIISLVGSAQYSGSSEVIPYLAGSLVFYGISVVFTSGLYVTGKTRTLAWVVGACAAINVLLNILLIPRAGKQGAAIATLITNAVMAVGVLVLSQARYRIPYRIGRTMAGVGLAAAVIAVSGTAGSQAIGRIGWARAAGALVFSLALLGIFGINRQDFRDALRALCSLVKSHPRTPAG
jgi:O-antigen/teichoic acid export membrane protein